jgi:hypothetical protein
MESEPTLERVDSIEAYLEATELTRPENQPGSLSSLTRF